MIRRLRRLWYRIYLDRCECGHLIWWWQKRVVDDDLGMFIHYECGDPEAAS